jgi:hypothetical protein
MKGVDTMSRSYKHLTEQDIQEGMEVAEILSMLGPEERKAFSIYKSALKDIAMFRDNKQSA